MRVFKPGTLFSKLWCWAVCLSIGCLLLGALPAGAVDGVIEINHAKAVSGGLTPGDLPDYPVTISQPGSYRLTGDLFYSGTNTDIIKITADHVSLDLNGFSIRCLYVFNPCVGTGVGVHAAGHLNIEIRHGSVRDMGSHGIEVGALSTIKDIRAISNGGSGIRVGDIAHVRGCIGYQNGGDGIRTSSVSVVEGNSVAENGSDGISAEFGSVISNNSSVHNAGNGIRCVSDCNVFRNSVGQNGAGILVNGLSTDNIATQNTSFGLDTGGSVGSYAGNMFYGNNGGSGAQVNGGTEIGTNYCRTNTTCP